MGNAFKSMNQTNKQTNKLRRPTSSSSRTHSMNSFWQKLIAPRIGTDTFRPLRPRRRYSHLLVSTERRRCSGTGLLCLAPDMILMVSGCEKDTSFSIVFVLALAHDRLLISVRSWATPRIYIL